MANNYPKYQIVEVITVEPVQLPGAVIASGVTAFVLEQQISSSTPWTAAQLGFLNPFQAYNNLPAAPNIYIVGSPWVNVAAAQAAAIADYTALAATRDGAVTQAQLQGAIGTSSYVNLITTVAGPG